MNHTHTHTNKNPTASMLGTRQAQAQSTNFWNHTHFTFFFCITLPINGHCNNGTSPVRVDATGMNKEKGTSAHVRFSVTHDDLEQCVGLATAAFALELMSPAVSPPTPNALPPGAFSLKEVNTNTASSIPPGIYFPSELPPASRQAILERVRGDASVWEFEVNTSQASS